MFDTFENLTKKYVFFTLKKIFTITKCHQMDDVITFSQAYFEILGKIAIKI